MKIPRSVRIGGVDYEVRITPNLRDGAKLLYGHIDYYNSVIELSDTDNNGHQARCITLLHEILHGITNHAELDFEKAGEEQIVTVLAKGIYQVLQDNRGLMEGEG
jgi:hypothetical protein